MHANDCKTKSFASGFTKHSLLAIKTIGKLNSTKSSFAIIAMLWCQLRNKDNKINTIVVCYWIQVRSLSITHWQDRVPIWLPEASRLGNQTTHWLTEWLMLLRLDWCDPGVWICQLKFTVTFPRVWKGVLCWTGKSFRLIEYHWFKLSWCSKSSSKSSDKIESLV